MVPTQGSLRSRYGQHVDDSVSLANIQALAYPLPLPNLLSNLNLCAPSVFLLTRAKSSLTASSAVRGFVATIVVALFSKRKKLVNSVLFILVHLSLFQDM